jgi:starch phosphorylase
MLSAVDPATWKALDHSEVFQDQYADTVRRFDEYLSADDTWWDRHHPDTIGGPIAYLCAEHGVHSSMPIYSGGLGVLAGDHTKSASDLGLPFVAVGLLYRRGYFRQEIEASGDQQHMYPVVDTTRMPVLPVAGRGGQLKVEIEFPGRTVLAAVWKMQAGRVPILLLDTDIPDNADPDRPITHMLYVRGREMRFAQEYILGIGAVRALKALGINPATWHVNEGHAAMSLLERLADEVKSGAALEDAERTVQANTLFTLHTPVPAGNEVFEVPLVEKYLSDWPRRVDRDMAYLAHLGSSRDGQTGHFDLGALAIRLSSFVNGVSQRHAAVATNDWGHLRLANPTNRGPGCGGKAAGRPRHAYLGGSPRPQEVADPV